jgi:dTDP-4-amino-4,6-dideoxygalactose transaminase
VAGVTAPVRFPIIRPELPPISAWAPILEEAYQANRFTNFGALSRRLEAELAARWATPSMRCVVASSATAALAAPLIIAGITGDVLVPAFTFPATASAVRMAGATPLLVDVSEDGWHVSADAFAEALDVTGSSAAILVAPFGLRTDFSRHSEIAASRGVTLIVDNAAGLGASKSDASAYAGLFEVFSLHATKPFGIGEGGAIFAAEIHEAALRSALNFGLPSLERGGPGPAWGINGKLSEFHAAVGLAVSQDFERRLALRRAMAAEYVEAFRTVPNIISPRDASASSWQLFPVLLHSERRVEAFAQLALQMGLETRRYYKPALSRLPDLTRLHPCPVSEDLAARMICLPIYSTHQNERTEVVSLGRDALEAS